MWYFKSPQYLFTSCDVNHSQQSCCISFHHAIDDMEYPFHCNLSFPTLVSFSYVNLFCTYGHHLHLVYNFPYSILSFFFFFWDRTFRTSLSEITIDLHRNIKRIFLESHKKWQNTHLLTVKQRRTISMDRNTYVNLSFPNISK